MVDAKNQEKGADKSLREIENTRVCVREREEMDLGNENVRVRIDGDRISSLPDEIIHHILSFNDTKYAVQTSVLSSRWKLVWTTLPYLKFSTGLFRILPKFSKFVNRVLSRRNNLTEVSTVDLYFRGRFNQKFVQNIANYAVSHNVQKVNIFACEHNVKEDHQFPLCLFSSQSLKHLSLKVNPLVDRIFPLPQSPWVSPALTTIELNDVMLCAESTTCLDLFSKCVSLMNLTLIRCCGNGLKVMKILSPRLVHLTISRCWLTEYEVVAPNLSSFCYEGSNPMFLYTGGLNSLDKVNLRLTINSVNLNEDKQTIAQKFMNLLHELRNAKFVTLYGPFIEFLSLVLDILEHQPSPFCNLKCLSIKEVEKRRKRTKSDKTNQVITYLLNSSPTATVNIEFQKETLQRRLDELPEEEWDDAEKRKKIFLDVIGNDGHGRVVCSGTRSSTLSQTSTPLIHDYEDEMARLREVIAERDRRDEERDRRDEERDRRDEERDLRHQEQIAELRSQLQVTLQSTADSEARVIRMLQSAGISTILSSIPSPRQSSGHGSTSRNQTT